ASLSSDRPRPISRVLDSSAAGALDPDVGSLARTARVLTEVCRYLESRPMSHPPAAAPALRMGIAIPNSKLGMWLFLGTEIMFFTAFIGTYIVCRMGSPGWPTDVHVTHIQIF